MRYVAGGNADSLLRREGPLPPGRVAEIISPVASALDAAHRAGLLHRDVKPSNMLMDVLPGRPDHVYLSDFGVSKAMASTSGLTRAGEVMGTLDCLSPEQIGGKPADGRADQYALACSAFELLTGAPPFRRDEPTAVMYAHLSDPPPTASSRRPGLPRGGRRRAGQGPGQGAGRPVRQLRAVRRRPARSTRLPALRLRSQGGAGPSGHRGPSAHRGRVARHGRRPGRGRGPGRGGSRGGRRAGHGDEHPRRAERRHGPRPAPRGGDAAEPAAAAPRRGGRGHSGDRPGRGGPDRGTPGRRHAQGAGRGGLGQVGPAAPER